ncbi:hypothetical protein [Chamaesiphon minutus]|uniref:Uncharacterized protein n=1 Tax=Chamaesiphon minutus (strain ATCC 27169 / PCC 6605) TaxID=1173020 RepID=K9UPC6_CHAP6|nr:hypothetical protein [Chamaesiphon minutus]AFY96054.1 hypothetical protein Cha6605_5159 [Chamaesiphon minutus PCC 6605]
MNSPYFAIGSKFWRVFSIVLLALLALLGKVLGTFAKLMAIEPLP